MSNPTSDQPAPQPGPKKTETDMPQSVLLVPYPKIVFLYPTLLLAISPPSGRIFSALPYGITIRRRVSARCSWGCSP